MRHQLKNFQDRRSGSVDRWIHEACMSDISSRQTQSNSSVQSTLTHYSCDLYDSFARVFVFFLFSRSFRVSSFFSIGLLPKFQIWNPILYFNIDLLLYNHHHVVNYNNVGQRLVRCIRFFFQTRRKNGHPNVDDWTHKCSNSVQVKMVELTHDWHMTDIHFFGGLRIWHHHWKKKGMSLKFTSVIMITCNCFDEITVYVLSRARVCEWPWTHAFDGRIDEWRTALAAHDTDGQEIGHDICDFVFHRSMINVTMYISCLFSNVHEMSAGRVLKKSTQSWTVLTVTLLHRLELMSVSVFADSSSTYLT